MYLNIDCRLGETTVDVKSVQIQHIPCWFPVWFILRLFEFIFGVSIVQISNPHSVFVYNVMLIANNVSICLKWT